MAEQLGFCQPGKLHRRIFLAMRLKWKWAATWENQQCGFWPGLTQARLYSHWRWLEAWNFGFSKYRDCTIRVAKTKALISLAVTAKLICVFVFALQIVCFPHDAAQIKMSFSLPELELQVVDLDDSVDSVKYEGKVQHQHFHHTYWNYQRVHHR